MPSPPFFRNGKLAKAPDITGLSSTLRRYTPRKAEGNTPFPESISVF